MSESGVGADEGVGCRIARKRKTWFGVAIPVAVAAAAAFTTPAQAAITSAHAHVAPQRQTQGGRECRDFEWVSPW